jgi:LysR family transcriptional activator of glutamate synthase operon
LSQQVKKLEKEIGEKLFERRGKNIRMTPAGRVLEERAKEILSLVDVAKEEMVAVKGVNAGTIIIATSEVNYLYILPNILSMFRTRFPGVSFKFMTGHSQDIVSFVAEGKADFGIATLPAYEARIVTDRLFWREDVLICHPEHPLNESRRILLSHVVKYPLLSLAEGSHTRQLFEDVVAKSDAVPKIVSEVESLEMLKRFVEIDLGVGIVPAFIVEEEVRKGTLRAHRLDWLPSRGVGTIRRRQDHLSPSADMFLRLLRNHIPNLWLLSL